MTTNANLPAMPVHEIISACSIDGNSGPCDFSVVHSGLSKREMFAMTAMQGILSSLPAHADFCPQTTARCAAQHADAMLAELERIA